MARTTLTAPGEDVLVGGADVDVFGTTTGGEVITVVNTAGGTNVELDASFAQGGDTVVLSDTAASYSATISGSRVILTSTSGTVVSIPIGSAGIAIQFANGDTRILSVVDGEAQLGGQTIANMGDTDIDPDPANDIALNQALQNLQGAETALAAFLAANATDSNGDGDVDGDDIRQDRQDAVNALNADLAADGSDAQLNADLSDANDDVAAANAAIDRTMNLRAAINDLDNAQDNLDDDQETFEEEFAEIVGEAAEFGTLTGDATQSATQGTYRTAGVGDAVVFSNSFDIVVGADGRTLEFNAPAAALPGTAASRAALLAEAQDALDAAQDLNDSQDDFDDAEAAADAIDPGAALRNDLAAAEADQADAQAEVDERAELRQDFQDATVAVNQVTALEDNVEDANVAIEDLGFVRPQSVNDGASVDGTAGNDIFVLNVGDGTGSATIDEFGDEGDDVFFIGSQYTIVNLAAGDNLGAGNFGDVGTLEVFVQQQANGDTILFFEDEAFSGNTSNGFQGFEVTLEDTDAGTLSLDPTGFLSIEETTTVA
ncbi:MAG: hypothetical protein WA954_04190 [Parerythrobacter sp.]